MLTSQSAISELLAASVLSYTPTISRKLLCDFSTVIPDCCTSVSGARFRLLNLVLHLYLRGVRVGSCSKVTVMLYRPVRAAGGGEVEQVIQPGELLLDHLRHAVFQRLRGGASVEVAEIFDRRRSNVRILRDRQRADRQHPGEHDENGDNPAKTGRRTKKRENIRRFLRWLSSLPLSLPARRPLCRCLPTISLSPSALRPLPAPAICRRRCRLSPADAAQPCCWH